MQIAELENERRVWFFTPKSIFPAYRSVRAGRGALHLAIFEQPEKNGFFRRLIANKKCPHPILR